MLSETEEKVEEIKGSSESEQEVQKDESSSNDSSSDDQFEFNSKWLLAEKWSVHLDNATTEDNPLMILWKLKGLV